YDVLWSGKSRGCLGWVFKDLHLAGAGRFQTGQPFTVNSINDVNLDGNLTDRLDTTNGIIVTGDRRQPLIATVPPRDLLARPGMDGRVGRNTFRAGSLLNLDGALIKNFAIKGQQRAVFRIDIFNFINRVNFGIPVRYLGAPAFGQATETVSPGRRVQISLKYAF